MLRPKPEEVTAYAETIGFRLSGNHFCDYYESKGWVVGKSPMKDWKAAVRNWKHNAPASALVGSTYNPVKFEQKTNELRSRMELEYEKRMAAKSQGGPIEP